MANPNLTLLDIGSENQKGYNQYLKNLYGTGGQESANQFLSTQPPEVQNYINTKRQGIGKPASGMSGFAGIQPVKPMEAVGFPTVTGETRQPAITGFEGLQRYYKPIAEGQVSPFLQQAKTSQIQSDWETLGKMATTQNKQLQQQLAGMGLSGAGVSAEMSRVLLGDLANKGLEMQKDTQDKFLGLAYDAQQNALGKLGELYTNIEEAKKSGIDSPEYRLNQIINTVNAFKDYMPVEAIAPLIADAFMGMAKEYGLNINREDVIKAINSNVSTTTDTTTTSKTTMDTMIPTYKNAIKANTLNWEDLSSDEQASINDYWKSYKSGDITTLPDVVKYFYGDKAEPKYDDIYNSTGVLIDTVQDDRIREVGEYSSLLPKDKVAIKLYFDKNKNDIINGKIDISKLPSAYADYAERQNITSPEWAKKIGFRALTKDDKEVWDSLTSIEQAEIKNAGLVSNDILKILNADKIKAEEEKTKAETKTENLRKYYNIARNYKNIVGNKDTEDYKLVSSMSIPVNNISAIEIEDAGYNTYKFNNVQQNNFYNINGKLYFIPSQQIKTYDFPGDDAEVLTVWDMETGEKGIFNAKEFGENVRRFAPIKDLNGIDVI